MLPLPQHWVAAHEPEYLRRSVEARRLRFIFAAVPSGIVPDRVDNDATPTTVASGNLGRQTRQRHQRVHEIGVQFAPKPCVHSAHRSSYNEAGVIHSEPLSEQTVIRFNHIEVTVMREFCVHPVTWLARFAVTDPVRQHDEVFRRIERLIFTKQFAGKFRANKLRAAARCSVHDENRIGGFTFRIFLRLPERPVMEAQLRQCFAGSKFEIADRKVAFCRRGIIGGAQQRCDA